MSTIQAQPLRYQKAREAIVEWIASGRFGPEGRLPPERELAEQFDMNRRTVRRALADLVAEGVLYKQARAGCFVRPTRPTAQRRVRAQRQGLVISIPLSRTFQEFLEEPAGITRDYLRGIADAGRENGAIIEFQLVPHDRHVAYMLDLVERDPPHGVVIYGAGNPKFQPIIERVIQRRIPHVAFQPERRMDWRKIHSIGLNYVTTDQQNGLRQATAHLIELGHRRIAFWEHCGVIGKSDVRFNGFRNALTSAGLRPDASLVHRVFDFETSCLPMLRSILQQGATALVTASDYIAMKVLQEAASAGIRIPDQLSVTGFDNNPATSISSPPLTTVCVDRYQTGREMVLALIDQHRHPGSDKRYQISMPARLIVRQSTAAPVQTHFAKEPLS